jgi:uncharacterized protein
MKILITGGTGMIGTRLTEKLLQKGHTISYLSREKKNIPGVQVYTWNTKEHKIEEGAFAEVDYIVHLAGENLLDKLWTKKQKRRIIESRVGSGNLLFEKVRSSDNKIKAFVSASAIGYYGAVTSLKIFTENDSPANDFVGICCQEWEHMADQFESIGIRTVKIRTSPVLSKKGGVLSKLVIPVKLGIGAPIGTGEQYFPWIHIDDLCDMYIKAIEDHQMRGAYNAAAPDHVTNAFMTKSITDTLKKPFWFPKVPAWIIKLFLGEMGKTSLEGSRISSEKIQEAGFKFKFPMLKAALEDTLKK